VRVINIRTKTFSSTGGARTAPSAAVDNNIIILLCYACGPEGGCVECFLSRRAFGEVRCGAGGADGRNA